MNTFLRELALAHQRHEGFFQGSLSWRNNNPGNLRRPNGEFAVYPTYAIGLAALQGDISAKIENRSQSMNRYYKQHSITYEDARFFDYIRVYAPKEDNNDPNNYCEQLCRELSKYNLKTSTPLWLMAKLVRGEIQRIPDDPPKPLVIDPEARIRGLKRRLENEQNPGVRDTISRLLQRLLARVGRAS